MPTYSGKYKITKPQKYRGDPSLVTYRSHWERMCFIWCEGNEDVIEWSSEETVVPYYYEIDKKYHRYFVDLKVKYKSGKTVLIEIKPEKQTEPPGKPSRSKKYIGEALTYVKNMNKWKAASSYAKDRGWDFQIWTEKTLQEMGLLVKPVPGKLKPLKRYAPYRRKRKK